VYVRVECTRCHYHFFARDDLISAGSATVTHLCAASDDHTVRDPIHHIRVTRLADPNNDTVLDTDVRLPSGLPDPQLTL
jgi:hypothetical protein